MARLRADIFVSAYLRRCALEGVDAVLRRRGSAEGGAIFVKIDRLDGTAMLYGPAPQALFGAGETERLFTPVIDAATPDVEDRIRREMKFDPDLWLVECDDRHSRHFLDLGPEDPAS